VTETITVIVTTDGEAGTDTNPGTEGGPDQGKNIFRGWGV